MKKLIVIIFLSFLPLILSACDTSLEAIDFYQRCADHSRSVLVWQWHDNFKNCLMEEGVVLSIPKEYRVYNKQNNRYSY